MNSTKKLLITFIGFIFSFGHLSAFETEKNSLIACENSLEMFEWDLEFIRHAEQSIEISACYFGGTILRQMLHTIRNRLEERSELQVYILACPTFFSPIDKEIIAALQKDYPRNFHFQLSASVINFFPDYSATDNHIKCLVVDEKYFSMGGTNLDEVLCTDGRYTPVRNPERENAGLNLPGGPAGARDQDVVGKGPIAKDLRVMFYKIFSMWENYFKKNRLKKDPEAFKDKNYYFHLDSSKIAFVESFEISEELLEAKDIKMVLSGPMHSPSKITQVYEKFINGAQKEISIGNLYFSPVDSVFQALIQAAKRGIELKVVSNGVGKEAPCYTKFFAWANRIHYVPLFYGREFQLWEAAKAINAPLFNTHIYEYNISDVVYHKKVMVVDRRYTIIGSYNLGVRSATSDYELILVIDSEKIAQKALDILATDHSLSCEVTPEEARRWHFDPFIVYIAQSQKKIHSLL